MPQLLRKSRNGSNQLKMWRLRRNAGNKVQGLSGRHDTRGSGRRPWHVSGTLHTARPVAAGMADTGTFRIRDGIGAATGD